MTRKTVRFAILTQLSVFALAGCQKGEETRAPVVAAAPAKPEAAPRPAAAASSLHSLAAKRLNGKEEQLSAWAGKVVLVVNTASECGYTPQYAGLEALYLTYEARGFAVLGFPSNDFGGQEPGGSEQIARFCKVNYGVTFPMFEKVKTKGADRSPVFALLSDAKGEPKWNFHKYLVNKKGVPVAVWPSAVDPSAPEISQAIEHELSLP